MFDCAVDASASADCEIESSASLTDDELVTPLTACEKSSQALSRASMLTSCSCCASLLTSLQALCTADTSDWKSSCVALLAFKLVRLVIDDLRLPRLSQYCF